MLVDENAELDENYEPEEEDWVRKKNNGFYAKKLLTEVLQVTIKFFKYNFFLYKNK
jgi:hypothetical protein